MAKKSKEARKAKTSAKKSAMKTTKAQKMTCDELMALFQEKREKLPYANEKNGKYGGWVTDFHIRLKKGTQKRKMALDLHNEADLFLLFVLAVAWSRHAQWKNGAFFVSYLKLVENLETMEGLKGWVEKKLNGDSETLGKDFAKKASEVLALDGGSCKKISLRYDTLESIKVLMDNWDEIKKALAKSNKTGDYTNFTDKMRSIDGLGATRNGKPTRMSMKILLILRELRIQRIYNNIPGELCCVPDTRVKKAAKNISDLQLSTSNTFESHVANSGIIYGEFGDWYDIPLFAFEDL